MPALTNGWTGGWYSAYRCIFGLYLFGHFIALVPWAAELFSDHGVLGDAHVSPLHSVFPGLLRLSDSPAAATGVVATAAVASLLLAIGWQDRFAALFLWYVGASLFARNPLIANPSLPFVGWLLLAHTLLPRAPFGSLEGWLRGTGRRNWKMPQAVFGAAWVVMAIGYSYSGFTKLGSPSWIDGSAVSHLLENPLARPILLREVLLGLPTSILQLATWSTLGLELLFAPLSLIPRLRPWIWGAMLGMHGALLVLVDFADLSLGMIMLQLFTLNPSKIPRVHQGRRTVTPEAANAASGA